MRLDLQELADQHSAALPGLTESLLRYLPGLREHHCSRGRPGGFVERLQEGTYVGHIVEHIALELSERAGIGVTFGKTVAHQPPRVYSVAVAYKSEAGMRFLLAKAVDLAQAVIDGVPFDLDACLRQARELAAEYEIGPSTRAILDAAERRGIPWVRLNDANLIQLGYGKHRRLIQAAMTSSTSAVGVEIAADKELTKELLRGASVPVPAGTVVRTKDAAVQAARDMDGPVVVKPLDGNQGKGVSLNLRSPLEVAAAFDIAREYSRCVLVEEMLHGRDYRVLLVDGKVIAAAEREPANVMGDGRSTVAQLVERENRNPLRGDGHEKPLSKLRLDDAARLTLELAGLTPSSVPDAGQKVLLRGTANLSTGGTARDVTEEIHPENRAIFEHAARVVGLDICGLDVVMPDISRPLRFGGGIVEVNAAPGLRMHHFPSAGTPRDVGSAIVGMLFPGGANGRIPIISTTGTNGKTTVTRMIAHALQSSGTAVGMTTTDGIWVSGRQIARGDTTGPRSARTILSDPSVEVAVLETARGGLVRNGLGYDWSDISILTNIQADHLGQDGIETVDDILHIKSLVAERVREGGTLILNADDPVLAELPRHRRMLGTQRNIVFVSLQDDSSPVLRRHLASGGTAYYMAGGLAIEAAGNRRTVLFSPAEMPITLGGTADFQVFNILAATAACRAHGLEAQSIRESLLRFRNADNPGRANLYKLGGSYVLVDYGHNPAAFQAVCNMTARWHSVCVTGVVAVPGDRNDDLIRDSGFVAGRGFDKIIIREDLDRRGRKPGEVADLLSKAIAQVHPDVELQVVLDERAAYEKALDDLKPGEVAVLFYDDHDMVTEILKERQAEQVHSLERMLEDLGVSGSRAA